MISKSTLQKAAEKNIITKEQVEPLFQFIQDDKEIDSEGNQDKPLKFVRSFGDVFITFGVVLLVLAINMLQLSSYYFILPIVGFIGLAEWLVRIRRLVLPGMAILISILWFVVQALPSEEHISKLALFVVIITSLLFYLRYNMPFSLLPLTAGLVSLAVAFIGFDVLNNPLVFSGFGLIIFVVAFWFDSRDTQRITHLSDNAFWLYLIASPLMVHGVMIGLLLSEKKLNRGIPFLLL